MSQPFTDDVLAEVRQIGGPHSELLINDARAGLIDPADLLRWVRDWSEKRRERGYPPVDEIATAETPPIPQRMARKLSKSKRNKHETDKPVESGLFE